MCTDIVISIKNRQQKYKFIFQNQGKNQKVWIFCNEIRFLRTGNVGLHDICHVLFLKKLRYLQRQSRSLCLLKFKGLVNFMEAKRH